MDRKYYQKYLMKFSSLRLFVLEIQQNNKINCLQFVSRKLFPFSTNFVWFFQKNTKILAFIT